MTTFIDYYELDSDRYTTSPEATPGNLATVKVRKGFVDTTKSPLNNATAGNAIKLAAGETVLDLWYRVVTAESASNAKVQCGFAGGAEMGANTLVTAANAMAHNATFLPVTHVAANSVTIRPMNGVNIVNAIFEVSALIVAAVDTF